MSLRKMLSRVGDYLFPSSGYTLMLIDEGPSGELIGGTVIENAGVAAAWFMNHVEDLKRNSEQIFPLLKYDKKKSVNQRRLNEINQVSRLSQEDVAQLYFTLKDKQRRVYD